MITQAKVMALHRYYRITKFYVFLKDTAYKGLITILIFVALLVGLEYFFTNNLSIGADLSVFLATLRKVTRSEGLVKETIELDKENYENLSRLEFSLGIRLYFWNK